MSVGDYIQFAAPPGSRAQMKQAMLPLNEGVITLQWPATLSPDSKECVDAWIELIVKRLIHKTAESTEDEPSTELND